MQYAERLPGLPSARAMVVPVVALVLGAAAATGAYAVLDDDSSGPQPTATRVIIAEPPAQPSAGVGAKNEAGVAAAIGRPAAVGQSSGGTEFRGSKASESGTSQSRFAQPEPYAGARP